MNYEGTITKEILDTIRVGDLVKVNDWKTSMRVVGVSENYFVMVKNLFGKLRYSVCEKKPWGGVRYNRMIGGMYHCGRDNMLFGWAAFDYQFNDEEQINQYLQAFETGEIELSMRGTIPISSLQVA
ncbi:hypothetical protein BP422_12090 [Brevibacillus formosus]|uniref:Uncharacterized protein n=1 Tax=Brevibacillus formosus TaxID=54913 RepID=A0A220MH00_9BACL|nr:hypothetical protein [Brevibacillus formosus]ASJ54222.1 hypothetical protein BP422_12090 [Brevibacillus formosus]